MDETNEQASGPFPGAAVRLLPQAEGVERYGTLIAWSVGPAGIMATADVELSPADVSALAGVSVWASIHSPMDEASDASPARPLTVLEGVVSPLPGGVSVTLTGALSLASEPRRRALRRSAMIPVMVGGEQTATIDLSRTGARISHAASAMPAEIVIALDLGFGDGEVITTNAEVVRIDTARGEIAVRFTDLAEADAIRIDRAVLAGLSGEA